MDLIGVCLIVLGIVFQGLFIYNDNKYHNGLSILLKSLASLFFILLGYHLYHGDKLLILIALCLDGLGDFILILRNVLKKHKDLIFISGTISFFIGHILLSIYLISLNKEALPLGIVINLLLFLFLALYLLKTISASRKMKLFGATYLFMIMFTSGLSISNYVHLHTSSNLLFMIGSLIFITSDLILMIHKFNPKASNILQPTYRILYYISQIMIALYIGL